MSIVADTSATVIPSGTWSIDPVWSSLEFEVKKLGLVTVKQMLNALAAAVDQPAVGMKIVEAPAIRAGG